ncbi:alpha-L-glutamate ligase-like protein [Leptospira meyeri]|uniref:alpha-L-glutamate ligase-like protein n=1 Tax=Leptospira meyeri TaxID=29508 RepID=UPI000C2A8E0E|nr:alpha-L-glutamate ligase-like protein [Leptospira meyeri]PKA25733.1 alpha-L-glutamate ligase-like protein [Leptospira sp. mixed culture ATI2-C-A1]MCW7489034.1 alpha-L-glutamate ligase-like protein [Leptospira meyeri]PJZ80294.1 alpha-L-glutamate ligase-like protein [Leptospira meyeri]PJZ95485.1 alpha-L-glutamate ligase-like protein [Leptospira meyeri]PKA12484.1 alpha-L-glutamate ligase-like protein [Leptospira meyeri]
MISIFKKFEEEGILGINRRIGEYILPYNPREYYPLVDDKWKTAELARQFHVPMPHHYGLVDAFGGIRGIRELIQERPGFVVKPANGGMGNGILVITGESETPNGSILYHKVDGKKISEKELHHHISGILSGLYSLDGNSDSCVLQERLECHSFFREISFRGIPDIRVIVFLGYPVMAMLRLPTEESGGRANLHQGALGVGVNLKTGTLTHAVCNDKIIHLHPDTKQTLTGRVIPHWETILEMASRCYDMSGLGYLGVDIVLDELRGPLLLEMNARPGLGIQIANRMGLRDRLSLVEKVRNSADGPKTRVHRMLQEL